MNDKAEELLALSDDVGEGDGDGSISPTPATVPKKRGRPSNPEKVKKPASGRGRGRPAKGDVGGIVANKKTAKAEGSEDEGTASDGGSPVPNGDAEPGAVVTSGRGRPPKGKRKLANVIEATGKGRGRPKKSAKTDLVEDDEAAGENDDEESSDYKPGKKPNPKTPKKGRGRPKKVQNSDDESSDDKMDDYEEKRTVGRPPSSGVNLNIVRTGRGQGRPKNKVAKRVAPDNNAENGDAPKKRGRPVSAFPNKAPYQPTGKPRGRPKVTQDKDSQDDDDEDEEAKPTKTAANNSDEECEDYDKLDTESDNY